MSLAFDAQASASGINGAQASVSLASLATGSFMVLWCLGSSGVATPIADPAGWTQIVRATVGSTQHWLGYRIKVGGDTTVAIGGGGGLAKSTVAAVAGYSGGGAFGEVSTIASGTGAATTIDPNAVTINNTDSMSVIVAGAGGNVGFLPSTNWTERVDTAPGVSLAIEISDRGPGLSPGSLDPGALTLGSAPDRVAYQIELTAGAAVVNKSVMVL